MTARFSPSIFSPTRPVLTGLIAVLGACVSPFDAGQHDQANTVTAPLTCTTVQPTGATRTRWDLTGGLTGPLGCVTVATQDVPGTTGQVTQFANGQVVTSPDQGPNMTVAVYQQNADLYVEWGDSAPYHYDRFLVHWDIDGVYGGQEDVPMRLDPQSYVVPAGSRTRGIFPIPLPRAGTYRITVEGCDYGTTTSSCNQGWTVPATITYVPPTPAIGGQDCGMIPDPGPIRDRWLALGGWTGALGCPVSAATAPPDGAPGQVQTFQKGQIGVTPAQGTSMTTVAAYQAESDVVVEWGDTSPYHYDKFNVRWSKDGNLITQNELRRPLASAGDYIRGIDHVRGAGPGTYTVQVEGCDDGTTSTCRQGFTFPLTVNVAISPVLNTSCTIMPSGVIRDRWSQIVGPSGPLLGCPTGQEQPLGTGKVQTFDHGQIVWSPDQGPDMTVAMYQVGNQLKIEYGDTFPFNYDKFIVSVNGGQADVTDAYSSGKITRMRASDALPPEALVVGQSYTAIVEGCDTSASGSTCRQGWTLPVSVTFVQPQSLDYAPSISFNALTPATTPAEANASIDDRILTVTKRNACVKTLGDVFKDEQDFANGALAKLELVRRGQAYCQAPFQRPLSQKDEVNSAMRFQQIRSATGTTVDTGVCKRTGEYDTALTGFITMLYRYPNELDNDVKAHILNDLLNARGPVQLSELAYCSVIAETENHVNQIESARYLTNQLLYAANGDQTYNNETNGMNDYMLARLQSFVAHDFLEYNSKPYQTYTVNSIQNLYDYATDRRVKMAAHVVLDYIAAKYAVSSNSLRRDAPYRRRVSHWSNNLFDEKADAQNARFTLLAGNFMNKTLSFGYAVDMQMAGISSYRAPDLILDMLMTPAHRTFFERIHHSAVELYSSTPDYLITAGGFWTENAYDILGAGDSDDDGPAIETSLMPTGVGQNVSDLIRFVGIDEGAVGSKRRLNTCVAPNFACGVNLRIPEAYTSPARESAHCLVKVQLPPNPGTWFFIDSATPGCDEYANGDPKPSGFFVAAYIEGDPNHDNAGFFEAHPRDGTSFDQFINVVETRNASRSYSLLSTATNAYTTLAGNTVQFIEPPQTGNALDRIQWFVLSTGNSTLDALGTAIDQWPLASGDVLKSTGPAKLDFVNAALSSTLTLDFGDVGEPKRSLTVQQPQGPPKCGYGRHWCDDVGCVPAAMKCM